MGAIKITDAGSKALRDDTQLTPRQRLLLEISARAPGIGLEELVRLAHGVIEKCGSIDDAIMALKTGIVVINRGPEK